MIPINSLKDLQNKQNEINDWTYIDIFNRLKEMAINMFTWKNLPDTMSARFIELNLFEKGKILFFKHNDDLLSLPFTYSQRLNMYYNPTERHPYSIVRTYPPVDIDNSVACYNNYLRTPTIITVTNFAQRLFDIQRTIDVNMSAQKTPVLITGEKEYMNTITNAYVKQQNNALVIVGNKSLPEISNIGVYKTDAPFIADKARALYKDYWAECMDFFGVNNANTDKKERLITPEANSNNELLKASRFIMLRTRQEGAEKLNRLFGSNASVEFNPFVDDITDMSRDNAVSEGADFFDMEGSVNPDE